MTNSRRWRSHLALKPLSPQPRFFFITMPLLDPLTSVEQSLRKNKIIPDVTHILDSIVSLSTLISFFIQVIPDDHSFRISTLFSVTWGETEVILGNELNVADLQSEPKVQITPISTFPVSSGAGGDSSKTDSETANATSYTVALVDADAPSNENRDLASPYRHWLVSLIIVLSILLFSRTH